MQFHMAKRFHWNHGKQKKKKKKKIEEKEESLQ